MVSVSRLLEPRLFIEWRDTMVCGLRGPCGMMSNQAKRDATMISNATTVKVQHGCDVLFLWRTRFIVPHHVVS